MNNIYNNSKIYSFTKKKRIYNLKSILNIDIFSMAYN